MNHAHAMTYRPEIDGLRAIAVLSVVLYHFGLPGLGGGFVGVDIFFVISGFLIGGILWDEWTRSRRIDIVEFFKRRVRRLAPAFFAMTTVTAVFAYFILLPFEFREFGKSLVAATLWLSNVQFFREAGYFDIGADSKLLLHTWSLSVEEQFYVALPLTLLFLRGSKRSVIGVLLAAWALSLVACIALTPQAPTATFFLFPFRAWELLSGVLLAIWGKEQQATWRIGAWVSWAGLFLLAAALTLIEPGTQFPGWQAMVPVAGTVLLLLNGRHSNLINVALASRVPAFIGLISYSLYLWHWPVLTLSTYWRGNYANAYEAAGWLLLAVVLAVAAWAGIERPVRRSASTKAVVASFFLLVLASVGAGLWAYLTQGALGRFSPEARVHVEASESFYSDWSRCSIADSGRLRGLNVCTVGPEGDPEVLFWGDSHLRAMMGGIGAAAAETKTPGLIVWHAGCPPLFGLAKKESAATPAQDQKCLADTEQMRAAIADMKGVRRVVLVGRWSYYAEGAGTGADEHNRIELLPATKAAAVQSQAQLYASAWSVTSAELRQHFDEVFVIRQVPEMPGYSARQVARDIVHRGLDAQALSKATSVENDALLRRVEQAEAPLKALVQRSEITLIDTWPSICTPQCRVVHNEKSYYFDNNHLSNGGAMVLRELLRPALTGRRTP